MPHWKVIDEESSKFDVLAQVETLRDAEAWIAKQESLNKDKVHRGGYGIDGPCPNSGETIVNEDGRSISG